MSELQPKNLQIIACRIELADLGLNFPLAKSILLLASIKTPRFSNLDVYRPVPWNVNAGPFQRSH